MTKLYIGQDKPHSLGKDYHFVSFENFLGDKTPTGRLHALLHDDKGNIEITIADETDIASMEDYNTLYGDNYAERLKEVIKTSVSLSTEQNTIIIVIDDKKRKGDIYALLEGLESNFMINDQGNLRDYAPQEKKGGQKSLGMPAIIISSRPPNDIDDGLGYIKDILNQ